MRQDWFGLPENADCSACFRLRKEATAERMPFAEQ